MKNITLFILLSFGAAIACAQPPKTELYNLVKTFVTDSTGYENVGDWSVGKPSAFPVQWKADKLEMSEDTSINFYRQGTANLLLNGNMHRRANPLPGTSCSKVRAWAIPISASSVRRPKTCSRNTRSTASLATSPLPPNSSKAATTKWCRAITGTK